MRSSAVLPRWDLSVEAPAGFMAPHELAVEVRLSSGATVLVLSVEDVLMYRLHEFAATGHAGVAEQAVALLGVGDVDRRRSQNGQRRRT